MSLDAAVQMFDDIRAMRPPIHTPEYISWTAAIGDCIGALPTRRQRWAATLLVANDLVHAHGLPLAVAQMVILEATVKAGGVPR